MKTIRNFFAALESGWRAGLKQFRKRRTELQHPRPRKSAADGALPLFPNIKE